MQVFPKVTFMEWADYLADDSFADEVAALCYKHYACLPKKGKPQESKEWTLLAAVVLQTQGGLLFDPPMISISWSLCEAYIRDSWWLVSETVGIWQMDWYCLSAGNTPRLPVPL